MVNRRCSSFVTGRRSVSSAPSSAGNHGADVRDL